MDINKWNEYNLTDLAWVPVFDACQH
jgi:hypothetical protein